ncbi:MAG: aspartate carbamoyltransferase catalytic subunit [Fimbriimonadaceae bacterium]|nr:MAG: aspartate carbamoyltransferase catalytic subunit [Fimbriimonadaceae bacterium]
MNQSMLAIRHTSAEDIRELIDLAAQFKADIEAGREVDAGPRRTIGLLFFENSTRTRVSFEQACNYLNYRVVNFSGSGSSLSKGESLKDTILTLKHERLEAVVMRHRASGAAQLAAEYFGGPLVNAGDGQHEHPTQALGDGLTVLSHKGKLEGLRVAIVGDIMHSRVARSNAWLFSKLGCEVRFVGPRTLIPGSTAKLPGEVYYDLRTGISGADVVMCLRLQKERMTEGRLSSLGEYRRLYQINRRTLKWAADDALVMHPGPINRGVEVDDLTADGPQSVISDQVTNGVYVRMAVLNWVFQKQMAAVAK